MTFRQKRWTLLAGVAAATLVIPVAVSSANDSASYAFATAPAPTLPTVPGVLGAVGRLSSAPAAGRPVPDLLGVLVNAVSPANGAGDEVPPVPKKSISTGITS